MSTNINKKNVKSMPYYEFDIPQDTGVDLLNYYFFRESLTPEEFSKVIKICDNLEVNEIDYDVDNNPYRKSKVGYIDFSDENEWLYDRIYRMATVANEDMGWNFEIEGIFENIEYCEYHNNSGYYMWHSDLNENPNRKMSLTLSLSTLSEYEGGKHHLLTTPSFQELNTDVNSLVIHPSYMLSRTTPVTSGVKRELKIWLSGKSFK